MTPRANKQADARAAIALLSELYPRAFFVHEAKRRPLKINIDTDIINTVNGAIKPHELVAALRSYCNNPVDLSHMRPGAVRINLDGNPAGIVTAEAAKVAADNWRRGCSRRPRAGRRRAGRRPILRRPILRHRERIPVGIVTEGTAPPCGETAVSATERSGPRRLTLSDLKEFALRRQVG
jgi:sRNA-binding protein